jgi:hypothetical protein
MENPFTKGKAKAALPNKAKAALPKKLKRLYPKTVTQGMWKLHV